MTLSSNKCVPCRGGIPPMSLDVAVALISQIEGWELLERSTKLRRTFTFRNFMDAQSFAVQVGEISESEDHHPDISYGWGYCTVLFFTHKINGLHENDFIMASKVNDL